MHHVFYTWCRAGLSIKGNSGWGVRDISGGISPQLAEQLVHHANYGYLRGADDPDKEPIKLAYFNTDEGQPLLVHCVKIGLQPDSSREGNYFAHIAADLGGVINNGLDAIRCWRSSSWVTHDSEELSPLGDDIQASGLFNGERNMREFLETEQQFDWAHYCLQAWKLSGGGEKIQIVGTPDQVAHLIYIIAACLPETQRRDVTFTTYDPIESPPRVRIHGVYLEPDADIPDGYYRQGQYSLNTRISGRHAPLPSDEHALSCRELLARLRDYGVAGVASILQFSAKVGFGGGRDMELAFRLFPETGQSIALDEVDRQHLFAHFKIQFIGLLTKENREGFFRMIREKFRPSDDATTRDWMLRTGHLDQLVEYAKKSDEAKMLLIEFFERLHLRDSLLPNYVVYLRTYLSGLEGVSGGRADHLETLAACLHGQAIPNPVRFPEACNHFAGEIKDDFQANLHHPNESIQYKLIYLLTRGSNCLRDIQQTYHSLYSDKSDFLNSVCQTLILWDPARLQAMLYDIINYAVEEQISVPTCLWRYVADDNSMFIVASRLAIARRGELPGVWGCPISLFKECADIRQTRIALDRLMGVFDAHEAGRDTVNEYFNHIGINDTVDDSGLRDMLTERIIQLESAHDKFSGVYEQYIAGLQPDDFVDQTSAILFLSRLFAPEHRQAWSTLPNESRKKVRLLWNIHLLDKAPTAWGGGNNSCLEPCIELFYKYRHDEQCSMKFRKILLKRILDSIKDHNDLADLVLNFPIPGDHPSRGKINDLDAHEKSKLIEALGDALSNSRKQGNLSIAICAILIGAARLNEDGTVELGPARSEPVLYQRAVHGKSRTDKDKRWMDVFGIYIDKFILRHYTKMAPADMENAAPKHVKGGPEIKSLKILRKFAELAGIDRPSKKGFLGGLFKK